MRWLVFILFSYVALAFDWGLVALFEIDAGSFHRLRPSFLLILAVYVAWSAAPSVVPWAMLALGIICDLVPLPTQGSSSEMLTFGPRVVADFVVIGPCALGFLVGGFVAQQLKGLMSRHSVLAFAIVVVFCGVFIHLVIVALLTLRGLPITPASPVPHWNAADQLARRFMEILYTALLAIPVGFILMRTDPIWDFPLPQANRRPRRAG